MYAVNPQSKCPIFQINQHIGFDRDIYNEGVLVQVGDGQGIDGRQFSNEVLSFNDSEVKELIFYVNSQGGDVQQSLDMFNSIAMSKKHTHAIITGFAFSCSGWIPLAADEVEMVEETGRWMCHMPYDPNDPNQKSEFMDEVVDIISKTIASKSGRNGKEKKSQEEIKKLMLETTYWDAQRMWDEGLIDRKVNSNGKVIRFEKDPITLNKSELNYYYKQYQFAQNKLITETNSLNNKTSNKMAYPKLVNRLNNLDSKALGFKINLSEDANEDVVIDTLIRVDNRLRALNDEMIENSKIVLDNKTALDAAKKAAEDKDKEAKDAMCQYNTMKEAFDKMDVENKQMKADKEAKNKLATEADLKFRQERAKNFVDKLIDQKKVIGTDEMPIEKAKEYLVNKATESYEDVVTQYSIIPVKVSAAKPGIKNQTLANGTKVDVSLIDNLVAQNRQKVMKSQFRTENGVVVPLYKTEQTQN